MDKGYCRKKEIKKGVMMKKLRMFSQASMVNILHKAIPKSEKYSGMRVTYMPYAIPDTVFVERKKGFLSRSEDFVTVIMNKNKPEVVVQSALPEANNLAEIIAKVIQKQGIPVKLQEVI